MLHLAVTLDDAVHLVCPVWIRHGGFQFLQLGGDSTHRAGTFHYLGHCAAAGHLADILTEIADGHAPIDGDLPLIGQLPARDHPEQRRFAGAVGAYQSNLLSPLESRGRLNKENLVAILLADIVETNHMCTGPGTRSLGCALSHVAHQRKSAPIRRAPSKPV